MSPMFGAEGDGSVAGDGVDGDTHVIPAVLHTAPAAVLIIDPPRRLVVYANPAAIELTGDRVRLPVDIDTWSDAAGLTDLGGRRMSETDSSLSLVAAGVSVAGEPVAVHDAARRGSSATPDQREASEGRLLWFTGFGLASLLVGVTCSTALTKRLGKKTVFFWSMLLVGICAVALFFLPASATVAIIALEVVRQFLFGCSGPVLWSMMGDVADYGEWKFGRRSTGLVYSASLFAIKTGLLVGGFLLPLFLEQFGFVRNAAQTATALLGITIAFSLAPGLFALLKAGALLIYPLDQKRVDTIERELAARRAAVPEPKLAS